MEKPFTLTDLNMYSAEVKALRGDYNEVDASPSPLSIKNILGYAKAVTALRTNCTGDTYLLMN
jgi:hypothetical protein